MVYFTHRDISFGIKLQWMSPQVTLAEIPNINLKMSVHNSPDSLFFTYELGYIIREVDHLDNNIKCATIKEDAAKVTILQMLFLKYYDHGLTHRL